MFRIPLWSPTKTAVSDRGMKESEWGSHLLLSRGPRQVVHKEGLSSTEHGCVVSGVRGQPGVVRQGRDRAVLWTDFGPKDLLKELWVPQCNILQKDSVKSWVKEEREMHKVIRVREDTG